MRCQKFVYVLFLILSLRSNATEAVRNPGEADDDFVRRVTGATELAHPVITSQKLTGTSPAIIAFTKKAGESGALVAQVLIKIKESQFNYYSIDSCGEEGGPPKVESVFFVHTDKSKTFDLAVLCSWWQHHATGSGTLYAAEFYRLPEKPNGSKLETRLKEKEALFSTCDCEDVQENGKRTKRKATFKSAKDVQAILKKLGFPQ